MSYPWFGRALTRPPEAFAETAELIDIEEAVIAAVWEVEAAGRPFRADGSLERRLEPHHLPGAKTTWRDSLRIPQARRDAMLEAEWEKAPKAAATATSWGAPQIMGFNARDAGYASAVDMVGDMAYSEEAQIDAFVELVTRWGIATHLRSHDWHSFAARYNGRGKAAEYARKIEAAYRRHRGRPSDPVLRAGDRGEAVRVLQRELVDGGYEIAVDGLFGPETEDAVLMFQLRAGLRTDGVVGNRTWTALRADADDPERLDELPRREEPGAASWLDLILSILKFILGGPK